jgi:hypothetical protein
MAFLFFHVPVVSFQFSSEFPLQQKGRYHHRRDKDHREKVAVGIRLSLIDFFGVFHDNFGVAESIEAVQSFVEPTSVLVENQPRFFHLILKGEGNRQRRPFADRLVVLPAVPVALCRRAQLGAGTFDEGVDPFLRKSARPQFGVRSISSFTNTGSLSIRLNQGAL